jgi:hypothetical protein
MLRTLYAGVALLLLGVPLDRACADESTIYFHSGSWDAFNGHTDNGRVFCGIGSTDPVDGHSLSIRFEIGGTTMTLTATKPVWSIPAGTNITVVMQIGTEVPWTVQADGNGRQLRWSMDQTAIQLFDAQFRHATTMTLTFPDGNEPQWRLPLAGSTLIDNAFGRCITDLSQRAQTTAQAAGQPATQPFGKPSTPPAAPDTAPAAPPPEPSPAAQPAPPR